MTTVLAALAEPPPSWCGEGPGGGVVASVLEPAKHGDGGASRIPDVLHQLSTGKSRLGRPRRGDRSAAALLARAELHSPERILVRTYLYGQTRTCFIGLKVFEFPDLAAGNV